MMYRDGLHEEIRAELGVHVFSTIDDIMQAALDVEEGDESDESGNRSKEKSRSGECETSGDADGSRELFDTGNGTIFLFDENAAFTVPGAWHAIA